MTATAGQTPSENGPGQYPLRLGSVIFWTNEVPEDLTIGAGQQMEETHTLTGGSRVVQTFGPSADDVTWTAKFWDQNVAIRVQQLRLYMVNALEIYCSFKGEQYYCIVKDFKPNYRGAYNTYSITLVITRDANGAFTLSSPTSIDAQVSSLFVQAQNANQDILTQQAANLDSEVSSVVAAAQESAPTLDAFQQPLISLQSAIQNAGPIAANITTAGPAIAAAATTASQGIAAYQDTLSGTDSNVVNAALLQASVTAIGLNANRGQSFQQTTQQGSNTYRLAVLQYGDVSQAYALAQANGLSSPFISAAKGAMLSLPPLNLPSSN